MCVRYRLSDLIWIQTERKTEPATAEEREQAMEQAQKLKEYLKRRYGAMGFTASSGNGFHLYLETERLVHHPAQVPDFHELLRRNEWLREMYHGEWRKYGYPSRSEAELAVVRELVHWGFSDGEIRAIMSGCRIGKWQESGESYRRNTIEKAREWEVRKVEEKARKC